MGVKKQDAAPAKMRECPSAHSAVSAPVKLQIKLSYALPRFTIRAAYVIIQVYGQLYYMQLGAKLRYMAFYMAIGRALDVITDPAMGWITDSTRSSLGRRKPYLVIGMFLYSAVLGALFFPPQSGDADLVTHWYGCCYCLFFAMDTFANVPYYALGMEITSDYEQRNSLYFWQHVLGQAGTMIGGVLPAVLSDFVGMELRDAYAITGWSFAAWYSFGIASILLLVRERPLPRSGDGTSGSTPPLVREMLRIYRNQAFVPWMMAYILDYAAIGILATMVPLFSQYVLVEPDATDCKKQCEDYNPSNQDCTCAKLATEWLGWIMASTFLAAMVSVPFWHWVARRFKKHTAWLIYSWWNALTGPFRIFCGKGSLGLTAVLSAINGSAFGGQFLGESVMADLSDYDEFLYGDRAEGMLGVVATLGPKLVLVVCFVIPLATVATAGFRDSVWPAETLANVEAGKRACEESMYIDACPKLPQPQNDSVLLITRLGVSIVPTLLALASNFFKWVFPLKSREQLDKILQGIEDHKGGNSAQDPITGKFVAIVEPADSEQRGQMWSLEMWGACVGGRTQYLQKVLSQSFAQDKTGSADHTVSPEIWRLLLQRAWCLLILCLCVLAASLAGTIACFNMLDKESTSWVPTSLCICSGTATVFSAISALRLKSAKELSRREVSANFMQKLLSRAADESAVALRRSADSTAPPSPPDHPSLRWTSSSTSPWDIPNEPLQSNSIVSQPCPWLGARPRHFHD